jgi:hypothetical protein
VLAEDSSKFALAISDLGAHPRTKYGGLQRDAAEVPQFNWNCNHTCYDPSRHTLASGEALHGCIRSSGPAPAQSVLRFYAIPTS